MLRWRVAYKWFIREYSGNNTCKGRGKWDWAKGEVELQCSCQRGLRWSPKTLWRWNDLSEMSQVEARRKGLFPLCWPVLDVRYSQGGSVTLAQPAPFGPMWFLGRDAMNVIKHPSWRLVNESLSPEGVIWVAPHTIHYSPPPCAVWIYLFHGIGSYLGTAHQGSDCSLFLGKLKRKFSETNFIAVIASAGLHYHLPPLPPLTLGWYLCCSKWLSWWNDLRGLSCWSSCPSRVAAARIVHLPLKLGRGIPRDAPVDHPVQAFSPLPHKVTAALLPSGQGHLLLIGWGLLFLPVYFLSLEAKSD